MTYVNRNIRDFDIGANAEGVIVGGSSASWRRLGAAVGVDGAEVNGQVHHAGDQGYLAVHGVLHFCRSLKTKQEIQ